MSVFDKVAARFARSIDGMIRSGYYVRGKLFLELANATVREGGYVLDYGCGPGRLSLLLAQSGFRILGADTSGAMIEEARMMHPQRVNLEFQTIEHAGQVLPPATYDAIVCSSVIEYVSDPGDLLQGFRRALSPSGVLIISYANQSSFWRRYWELAETPNPMSPAQRHVWTWRTFRTLLTEHGFEMVTKPRFFEWGWDWPPVGLLFRRVPWAGSIGVVVAKPRVPHVA